MINCNFRHDPPKSTEEHAERDEGLENWPLQSQRAAAIHQVQV